MSEMVLVPKEPTEAMVRAAALSLWSSPVVAQQHDAEQWMGAARSMLVDAFAASPSSPPVGEGWQPIETAPKDGTWIVVVVSGANDRWEHLNGRAFVVRHEGTTNSGYDLGWSLHPGFGGVRDCWFAAWMPLPPPPALLNQTEER